MTTIVYADMALYADRATIHPGGICSKTESVKIQISEDKQFAYASAWVACVESERKAYEQQIRVIIEHHIRLPGDWAEGMRVEEIFGKRTKTLVHDRRTLILTRADAYLIGSDGGTMVHLTTNRCQGIGSGGNHAVGRIEAGLSPVEAIAGLGLLDLQTGSVVDTLRSTELKQFVYMGVKP